MATRQRLLCSEFRANKTKFCKKTNNNNETDYDWGIVVNERKHYLSLVSDRCK